MGIMARELFVTSLYEAEIGNEALTSDLARSIRTLSHDDGAGRRWSKQHHYAGYTSYASLNDLPKRDPVFADLAKMIARHVTKFTGDCAFDLDRKLRLDSMWVNVLNPNGHHGGHIHPHSVISGTFYVEVPKNSGSIRFEDPRLPLLMAAPSRRNDADEKFQSFISIEPRSGLLLMWESWLRHEVLPGSGRGDRLSISFNFA